MSTESHVHDFRFYEVCNVCGQTDAAVAGCHHCDDAESVKNGRCWWCLQPTLSAGPSPRDEAIRYLDEAASELDLITSLLSDRSEPGTYAKVEGLLTAWEARDEAIRTLIAQWRAKAAGELAQAREYNHRGKQALDAYWDGKHMARRDCANDLESLLGAIERQDDKS